MGLGKIPERDVRFIGALLENLRLREPGDREKIIQAASYLGESLAHAPDCLRRPLQAATAFFTRAVRTPAAVERWRSLKNNFTGDALRLYESLAILGFNQDTAAKPPAAAVPATEQESWTPEETAEIVVIGSGPGGAVTACLLAEAGRDVLLLEEGKWFGPDQVRPFSPEEIQKKYRNAGSTVAMGGVKVSYPEGRCVGGGSEVNSGLFHRTPPDILDEWRRDFNVEGLSESELNPHFQQIENDLSISPGAPSLISDALRKGAAGLNWRSLDVPIAYSRNIKQSMTQTYLPRFLNSGGRLRAQTRVHSLRRNGNGWTLRALDARRRAWKTIHASDVFVAAGAIHTPALLRRSGVHDRVGATLHFHPTIKVVAEFDERVNDFSSMMPNHQVKEFSPRISMGCSASSAPFIALGLLDHPEQIGRIKSSVQNMAVYYAMIRGGSDGGVRAVPGHWDPLVRYRMNEQDFSLMKEALDKLSSLLFEAGARALYPSVASGPIVRHSANFSETLRGIDIRQARLQSIHVMGTCRMGEDPKKCATDSFGRVHGAAHLFISDASLLCSSPGVNPQGTIMTLARRNALRYLKKL